MFYRYRITIYVTLDVDKERENNNEEVFTKKITSCDACYGDDSTINWRSKC